MKLVDTPFDLDLIGSLRMITVHIVNVCIYIYILVGGLEHEFYFSTIYGIVLPIDELILFKMVIAPTSF